MWQYLVLQMDQLGLSQVASKVLQWFKVGVILFSLRTTSLIIFAQIAGAYKAELQIWESL